MSTQNTQTYSGFVAIVGPTNAGKSTLLNQIMGRKVSIVSHKVQTTRTNLRAVKMVGTRQLIFVDTPGVFVPKRRLDRAMVGAAMTAISDADAVLLIMDAQKGITQTICDLIEKIHDHKNLFVALNKVDAIKKQDLLPIVAELSQMADWREIFMISALKNDGVDGMLDALAAVMPASPYMFDASDAVDVPDNLYLSELTREKIYKYINDVIKNNKNLKFEIIYKNDKISDYVLVKSENSEDYRLNFFIDDFYFERETIETFINYRNSMLKMILDKLKKYDNRLLSINSKL